MPTAYSYIRFSTAEQSKGDSKRRQLEKSQQYAVAHGLNLDTSLSFNDLGKSAYRGDHAASGGLGLFITAIDEGRVERGSYLLIENLDRLSRQPAIEALRLLQSIVSREITVVTLGDGRIYTESSLRDDPTSLLVSIVVMFRAHEESKVKGARLRAAWTRKKQTDAREHKPITNMIPAWLKIVDDKFEVIEERAKAIQMIFDLATNDGLGQRAICTRLKRDGISSFSRTGQWSETTVRRILTNLSVIGIYQPYSHNPDNPRDRTEQGDAIEGYFPSIVSVTQFHDAQRLRSLALIPRGPRGNGVNTIFTGIAFCGCGATMRRKGTSKNDPTDRLRCSAVCGAQSWKYEPLEKAVLTLLSTDLLPHVEAKESDRKTMQGRLAEAKAKQVKAKTAVAGLTEAIEVGGGKIPSLVQRLIEAGEREIAANDEVAMLQSDLRNLDMVKETAASRNEAIAAMAKAMKDDASGQLREKLRYALSRSVDRIVLEDNEVLRTARVEVGNVVRHIDFSREDRTFWLRGEEESTISSVNIRTSTGQLKSIIP